MRQLNLPGTSQIRANTAIIGGFAQTPFMRRGPRREANARPAHRYDAPMSVEYFDERQEMVAAIRVIAQHLAAEVGKTALDDRVLKAMAKIPRHEFVPVEVKPYAYLNRPLPIGFDKTISQPLMVAVMTDLLELRPDDVVLEIGTGLGYQSAVLAELAGTVYTVEIIEELAQRAVQRLKRVGYANIDVHVGNGYFGWPEHAPFDKVIVTAAPRLDFHLL